MDNKQIKDIQKRQELQVMDDFFMNIASRFHSIAMPLAFFTVGSVITNAVFGDGLMTKIILWSAVFSAALLVLSFICCCFALICAFKINKLEEKR